MKGDLNMYYPIYVDGQAVTLLGGQEADIDLEYDERTDEFVLTADCERWIGDFEDFHNRYSPNEPIDNELFDEARADCSRITGRYSTLREINRKLEDYCNPGDWYEFTWEYDDGTPVE